jgi:hypothetical protein
VHHRRVISLLALNGLWVSEATGADIENLGVERGHRSLVITSKVGKVTTIPLAPRTARATGVVSTFGCGDRREVVCGHGPEQLDLDPALALCCFKPLPRACPPVGPAALARTPPPLAACCLERPGRALSCAEPVARPRPEACLPDCLARPPLAPVPARERGLRPWCRRPRKAVVFRAFGT